MTEYMELEFKSPDMKFYINRLKTFETWSNQIQPNKFQLSSAGFYYTGRSDIVECFSCSLRLHQWKTEDCPIKEHKAISSQCLFLNMIGQSNSDNHQPSSSLWSWNPWLSTGLLSGSQDGDSS